MAIIINSIAFENLYSYYGSYAHNEYKFTTGLNLISASGGRGKSNFYNGIMWLLRNEVYDSDIKAFKDANESLTKMAAGKAKAEDNDFKVGVKVVFTNGVVKYTIERYSLFTRANSELNHTESKTKVIEHKDNKDNPIIEKDEQLEVINGKFIPFSLRNYALLQGESMNRLVDLSSKKALYYTIDTLTGISILKGICDISKKLAKRADNLFHLKAYENSANSSDIKEQITQRNQLLCKIETTLSYIEAAKEDLDSVKSKKDELGSYVEMLNSRMKDGDNSNTEGLGHHRDVCVKIPENKASYIDNLDLNEKEISCAYDFVNNIITDKEKEITEKQKMIVTWQNSLDLINKKLTAYKKSTGIQKYEEFATLMKKIDEVIKQTKDDFFDKTLSVLAVEANGKYKALTSGNQSSGGQLKFERYHDVVNVSIRDIQNGELTGFGAGFQRMKQLAIVLAIISLRKRNQVNLNFPCIIDEPFSCLSEIFISNILKVIPGVFSQSIILTGVFDNPLAQDQLTTLGHKLLEDMQSGKLIGTFYRNLRDINDEITEFPVTSHICYKE